LVAKRVRSQKESPESTNAACTPFFFTLFPVAEFRVSTTAQVPMPFAFSYAVKDDSYGINDYSHDTTSDGTTRTGIYRTLLPDGRTQTVTYKATPNGYLADVKYEGVAKYPEYQPAYKPAYPVA